MSKGFIPFAQERVTSKWENVVDYRSCPKTYEQGTPLLHGVISQVHEILWHTSISELTWLWSGAWSRTMYRNLRSRSG